MNEDEIREQARRNVAAKKAWFMNFSLYLVVNAMLIMIWAVGGRGYPWFLWVLGGWGIGVVAHFVSAFFGNRSTGWERRETEKEADRIRQQQ